MLFPFPLELFPFPLVAQNYYKIPMHTSNLDPMVPWAHIPNGITIGSAVFAGLTVVIDRQTDRPRYSVCSNRPHVANAAMRPKMQHLC